MAVRIYVPRETTALALEADDVVARIEAEADARGAVVELVRNGSRGLFWLEPLVEVETAAGRIAYGPVAPEDVVQLVEDGLFDGSEQSALCQGPVESIPYLKAQQRLTFSRIGVTDPLSLDDYRAHEGFGGLERALSLTPQAIVDEVKASGLRGRGGAAFPTGIKWQTVLDAPVAQEIGRASCRERV